MKKTILPTDRRREFRTVVEPHRAKSLPSDSFYKYTNFLLKKREISAIFLSLTRTANEFKIKALSQEMNALQQMSKSIKNTVIAQRLETLAEKFRKGGVL
jgi:hypothetical protein